MNTKPVFALLAVLFLFIACREDNTLAWKVEHAGALSNVMKKNDLSAYISLDSLSNKPHLYAVGALEGLKGEIIISNSKPIIAKVDKEDEENDYIIDNTYHHKAAFLVYAQVEHWEQVEIPVEIKTRYDLERFIKKQAKGRGIPEKEAFPFLIEGLISSFSWHIVDWDETDSVHTHEKHIKSGLYHGKVEEMVQLIGFYSPKHHGVFTHHSSNMHLHVLKQDHTFGAHLDDFVLGERMILKLPK